MPIKYIGRTTDFCGKPLWEILGNLKNFGVGRLVKRHVFDRYPEPSFFRIVKVEAVEIEPGVDRRVRAWVEKVFRGRRYPKLIELHRVSYKADYRLISKTDEKALWDKVSSFQSEVKVLPSSKPFPPLLTELIKEEMEAKNMTHTDPSLKLKVKRGRENFYKTAQENEVPNAQVIDTFYRKQFDLKSEIK
ncbi:small ribosomal subunit protein mS34 [Halyomorpha halys]|uniref:small ribosomal subunit protein mS34 n=1 Tax=Halyomorpha halys TaxID=286706 RepID=UPI0006D504E7|nr:uncharacterized protein LOC106682737 [Halyomorpha halys]